MAVLSQENKIIKNQSGEVLTEDSAPISKLLQIDVNDQIPNMILKSQADNTVKQTTDKANEIPFVQSDTAKQLLYKHGLGYQSNGRKSVTSDFETTLEYFYIQFNMYIETLTGSYSTIFRDSVSSSYIALRSTGGYYRYEVNLNGEGYLFDFIEGEISQLNKMYEIQFMIINLNGSKKAVLIVDNTYILEKPASSSWVSSSIEFGGWYNLGVQDSLYCIDNFIINELDGTDYTNALSVRRFEKFNYYHRYKDDGNNLAYVSTRYTKDISIDDNNNLHDLYGCIGNVPNNNNTEVGTTFYRASGVNYPELTRGGIKVKKDISNSIILRNSTDDSSGVFIGRPNNIMFNFWFMLGETPTSFNYFSSFNLFKRNLDGYFINGLIGYNFSSSGKFFFNVGDGFLSGLDTIEGGKFYHIMVLIDFVDSKSYPFVNGVLQGSQDFSAIDDDLYGDSIFGSSNTYDQYYDDIHIQKNSTISPTGFAIGDKVFEPPMRGGFDSIIKQY